MRSSHVIATMLAAGLLAASPVWAQQAPAEGPPYAAAAPRTAMPPEDAEGFSDHLVLDDGRTKFAPPATDMMRGQVHGEYQVRYTRQTDPTLEPPPSDPTASSLGQENVLYHWLRITPRFDFRQSLSLIGQIDVPYGFALGEETRFVNSAAEPFDERNPVRVSPRWLYLEARTPYGLWRVGQQGSHWGLGILANDGDHPTLFGDYRRGAIVERIMFATRPAGRRAPLSVAIAGDLVFRDRQADLTDDDRAFQGVLALLYGSEHNRVGLYGVIRHQSRNEESLDVFTPYTETLDVRVADFFGKFRAPVPGAPGYLFGEAEAAVIVGSTDYVRNPELGARGQKERIRSYGGAARLGAVHEARDGENRWGDLVLALEWGYATGDGNPNDGTQKRFTFEPNYNVGLVLFDHLMAWNTARAAVNASDPTLLNRASPGLQFYPSDGGVFGATYLYPTVVVRPKRWLDLKGAVLIAQTTADLVDPYHFGALGRIENFRGGDPKRHDLGVELDFAAEVRVDLEHEMTLQLGAQAGVLFPGHAFDDQMGNGLPNQALVTGRLGLQY